MRRAALLVLLMVGSSCADEPTVAPPDGSLEAAPADGDISDAGADAEADAPLVLVDSCRGKNAVAGVWLADPHLCLELYADKMTSAREMAFAPNGDLFVMTSAGVLALFDANADGFIGPTESSAFGAPVSLAHGVALDPTYTYLYESDATSIRRWKYSVGDHVSKAPEEIVVKNIPSGGHNSRTLLFDAQGRLYVNVGSASDIDESPSDMAIRAMVRRFTLPQTLPTGGIDYSIGEVFASGMRNEVGLAFDREGRMWGVENGNDTLHDPVLGDVSKDNPAEEINRLDGVGSRFFGYPLCWTEFSIPDGGLGPRTQWATKIIAPSLIKSDSWCRDTNNVRAPAGVIRGHSAPLGITGYGGNSLPWAGDLFITAHGSSTRTPPVGRIVMRAHLVADQIVSVSPLVGKDFGGNLEEGTWDARPVDIREGPDGALYISDDAGGRIFRLGYRP